MPLGPHDEVGAWISHFYNSDNPKFHGISKAKRIKMAIAAYHQSKKNHSARKRKETETLRKVFGKPSGQRKISGGKLRKDNREDITGFSYKSIKESVLDKKVLSPKALAKRHGISLAKIKQQLGVGTTVEHEHTSSNKAAKRIALAHIKELPDYYSRLKRMEGNSLKEMLVSRRSGDSRKDHYRDQVIDIIKRSYEPLGGYKGVTSGSDSEKEIIDKDYTNTGSKVDIITARLRKKEKGKYEKIPAKVKAVALYKDQNGQKAIAIGHDGSKEGKNSTKKILNLAKDPKNSIWGEFSGPLKHIADKMGLPKVSNKYAEKLVGKKITPVDDHSYQRDINGQRYTKGIYGYPKFPEK